MMNLRDYFEKVKKVRPATLKNYMLMLRKLNENEEPTTPEFLKNVEFVLEYIKKLSLTTQRTYLICVISALSSVNGMDEEKDVYYEKLQELNFQYDERVKHHKKSAAEDENMCSLEELKLCADYWLEMLDEVIYNEKHHRKVWDIYRFAIIALLYTDIPPIRLDYASFLISKNIDDLADKNGIYVDEDGEMSFILQHYKTSGIYNEKIYKPTTRLKKIIGEWIEINDTGFLFPNRSHDAPMTQNAFGKMIPKVFNDTGKKITINLIRHIWITDEVDLKVLEQNSKLADAMCHSVGMQKAYIKV
jgi:hypothetical protein